MRCRASLVRNDDFPLFSRVLQEPLDGGNEIRVQGIFPIPVAYRDALKLLLGYASDTLKMNVEELAVEDLDESLGLGFLDHVEKTRSCSPRTRNARPAAILALFGFMTREEPPRLLNSPTISYVELNISNGWALM
jgi:hypothetical protein